MIEKSYSDDRTLVTYFWDLILSRQGTWFYFDYEIQEKEDQNTLQSCNENGLTSCIIEYKQTYHWSFLKWEISLAIAKK
jgi:hypothetical protein